MNRKPAVFMVEDDNVTARAARLLLEHEGWLFGRADRAGGALEAMRAFRPDVVLLDVNLPDGDGFAVCRGLRADGALAQVPAIFLTGYGDTASRLKAFEAGAQDYIVKPFSPDELTARLRVHLGLKRRLDFMAGEKKGLELRERARLDLADAVVHDMRTPATCIKATLELLMDGTPLSGPDKERLVSGAMEATEFLVFLINDLLDLQTGRLDAVIGPVDLEKLCARLSQLFSGKLSSKAASLKLGIHAGAAPMSDTVLLLRMAVNLIGNALRYTPAGGCVEAVFSLTGGGLRLEVLDRGPGVPDKDKEHIFRKFGRSTPGSGREERGKGIGLSFCRQACEALKGRIWVEDREGGGSRFVVELPSGRNGEKKGGCNGTRT